jgi:hypothetical protein
MSDNQQTPETLKRSLFIIIAAIILGTGWFVWQSKKSTDKTLNQAKTVQKTDRENPKPNPYADWELYKWVSQGTSFKYPKGWFVSEDSDIGRLYIKNKQVDLSKEETPEDFQQVWISYDTDETAEARETAIKNGTSDFRVVNGPVKASTIAAGGITVRTYAYETVGGPTLEGYWTNKAGTRLMATTSTEVGQQNQTDMVATLKKLLATVSNLQ